MQSTAWLTTSFVCFHFDPPITQRALLDEQALLQLELESALGGNPAPALASAMDSDMDSKSWVTAGPRSIAASLQSPATEAMPCTVGTSIEPAVSSRKYSQQTNSHPAVLGALACLMATTTTPSSFNFNSSPLTAASTVAPTAKMTSINSPLLIKAEPHDDVSMTSWMTPSTSWTVCPSERPPVGSSSLLSFNSLPMIDVG